MGKKGRFEHDYLKKRKSISYEEKRTEDQARFQDKILTKSKKRVFEQDETLQNPKRRRRILKEEVQVHKEHNPVLTEDPESYDPLSKDMDNDGIDDRYDFDFRDSEETYTEKPREQSKSGKRKNYQEEVYTRKKTQESSSKKETQTGTSPKDKTIPEGVIDPKARKRTIEKGLFIGGAFAGVSRLNKYGQRYVASGSDENVGLDAASKVLGVNSKLLDKASRYVRKRKRTSSLRYEQKFNLKKSKLEFREAKSKLKKSEEYQRASAFKKFQKRKQMKAQIYKANHSRIRDRIKQAVMETLKGAKDFVLAKAKGLELGILALFLVGGMVLQMSGTTMTGIVNGMNGVVTTSYLSDESVLGEVNQQFSSMEQGLQDELDSVESNYPDYDEYLIHKEGEIGHSTHELLSYLTSRYGEIKNSSEVSNLNTDLFEAMYSIEYREEIEIRYRTVTTTYVDEEGNEYEETTEEPYEYKKLHVTLHKKEMDTVIRGVFADYPDNLIHYEALLETQGNMADYFGTDGNYSEIVHNPAFENPGLAFSEESVKQLFAEADKHVGKRYVFGANGPNNFDCSSFVCWTFTHSGIKNMPRTTAYRIFTDYCDPVSPEEAKAGDIIFFTGTYDSGTPISHVGIYAGNGVMVHAGDPIKYSNINTPYWKQHFYTFGRVRQ
ncbi:CD1108 family mobile element protein [Streptococcus anginosus]|uniref:CD1108 family mobile element protein n=1 Tax=Streptococcus anginosus TaxID=1328 RepID=UPI0022E0A6FF|nr:NlpC/P60 family protein [Streptococcus anginosus]